MGGARPGLSRHSQPGMHKLAKPMAKGQRVQNSCTEVPNPLQRADTSVVHRHACDPGRSTHSSESSSDSSQCACTTKSVSSLCRSRYSKNAGDFHSPAASICHSGAPDSCKSFACPLRRSWQRYSCASVVPHPSMAALKVARAWAGVMSLKGVLPSFKAPTSLPMTCTGHVCVHCWHQQLRRSVLPLARFFLQR